MERGSRRVSTTGHKELDDDDDHHREPEDDIDENDKGADILEHLPKRLREVDSAAIPRHHEQRKIGVVEQLAFLLCKCIKMSYRNKMVLIVELVGPIFGVALLAIYTATFELDNDPNPTIYAPFGYDTVHLKECNIIHVMRSSPYVDDIMADLRNDRSDNYHVRYDYVTTLDFEARLQDGSLCAVVNFLNLPPNRTLPLPVTIRYELRLPAVPKYVLPNPITGEHRPTPIDSQWQGHLLYPSGVKVGPRNRNDNNGGNPGYYSEGFLYLQHKIDCILIKLIFSTLPGHGQLPLDPCSDLHVFPHFQRFPNPAYQHVNLHPVITKWLALVLVVSYVTLFSRNTFLLVKDKEVGMKGFIEYFDISPWKQWLSWISYKMILHSIVLIPVTFILTAHWAYERAVINKSSGLALYFFLLTYVLNCLCASCLFSTFFNRANSAIIIAGAAWFLSYLPSVKVSTDVVPDVRPSNDDYFSILGATVYCFTANLGLSYGLLVISKAELNANGISFDTFLSEDFDLGHVIVCLNVSSFASIMLTMYIERILPSSNANEEPLPLLYFLSVSWWKGDQLLPPKPKSSTVTRQPMESTNPKYFERNPKRNEALVELVLVNATRDLRGATGIFKVNLRCSSGEIVAILGPQKSGKTALARVCAGLLPVTRGAVFIKKRNISTSMPYARSNIGICPQVNALYDYLTVEEHFSLFVQLKGVIVAADAYQEILTLISALDLEDIRKVPAGYLTPGQKRFVHIGIAFASGSKIIVLDEPTENMDVPMKRTAWRFFDSERSLRSIILLTKNAEEASYVGDRVLVLIKGEVYVRGSPGFIKNKFDGGYLLQLRVKDTEFSPKAFLILTKKIMPRAKLVPSSLGETQVKLLLPDEYTPFFPSYFESLQSRKAELGIEDMDISFVPFEEVLKNITKLWSHNPETKEEKRLSLSWRKKTAIYGKAVLSFRTNKDMFTSDRQSPVVNFFRQILLLLLSNQRFTSRSWKWFISPSIIAALFVFAGPFILQNLGFSRLQEITSVELIFEKVSLQPPQALFKCVDNYKLHADFCASVRSALGFVGMLIDNATIQPMDTQLLADYTITVTDQDLNYDLAIDVKFGNFENDVLVYFDNRPIHILGAASRFFTKLLYLRMRAASVPPVPATTPQHDIIFINNPLPYTIPQKLRIARSFVGPEVLLSTSMVFGSMFYLPNIIFQFTEDTRFKLLLKSSGVNIYAYWLAKLTWDFFVCALTAACISPFFYILGFTGFDNAPAIVAEAVVVLCYAFSAVSYIYLLSFVPVVVSNKRYSFFYVLTLSFVIGPIPWTLLTFLTEEIYDEGILQDRLWLGALDKLFLLLPGHALATATHRVGIVSVYGSECSKLSSSQRPCSPPDRHPCCDVTPGSYQDFERFGILWIELRLVAEGIVILIIILILESSIYYTIKSRLINLQLRWKRRRAAVHPERKDRLENLPQDFSQFVGRNAKDVGFEILLNNLTLQVEDRTVVEGLTLGILKNQSFGFTGKNGSGRNHAVRLMSGFSYPTSGDVSIEDISLVKDRRRYISQISHGPNESLLHLLLTGRETFHIIGTVKGVEHKRLNELIVSLSLRLGLASILDKLVLDYDSGSRRKLSFALALIGKPRVLLLENPFREVDPETREQMMNLLLEKRGHATIVISSSDMEFSVSFCDRIALLIDGKLACMGSPEFLTKTYSQGITIIIHLVPENFSVYSKQGLIYHYEKPKGTDSSGSSGSDAGDGVNTGKGKPIPDIVISRDSTEFLQPPVPKSGRSSDSAESGGSSKSSSYQSSINDDAFWEQELDPIMEYMEDNFPGAVLFDKSVCYLHYHLAGDVLDLSDIFKKMEIARIGFELEAYRVGTGTLSQLLGNFSAQTEGS